MLSYSNKERDTHVILYFLVATLRVKGTGEINFDIFYLTQLLFMTQYTILPTPVFLPGESQGRGSLVGCRLWGRTESDTTEVT